MFKNYLSKFIAITLSAFLISGISVKPTIVFAENELVQSVLVNDYDQALKSIEIMEKEKTGISIDA
ncbi:MAG: hypothetical protein RR782_08260, partial [Clostridium sp.]